MAIMGMDDNYLYTYQLVTRKLVACPWTEPHVKHTMKAPGFPRWTRAFSVHTKENGQVNMVYLDLLRQISLYRSEMFTTQREMHQWFGILSDTQTLLATYHTVRYTWCLVECGSTEQTLLVLDQKDETRLECTVQLSFCLARCRQGVTSTHTLWVRSQEGKEKEDGSTCNFDLIVCCNGYLLTHYTWSCESRRFLFRSTNTLEPRPWYNPPMEAVCFSSWRGKLLLLIRMVSNVLSIYNAQTSQRLYHQKAGSYIGAQVYSKLWLHLGEDSDTLQIVMENVQQLQHYQLYLQDMSLNRRLKN
jgi:hypothetical protein